MLRGTLDDFTLPDIFRLMSLSKKTGSLQVERSAGQGKVWFRDGEVYYAESSLSKEPLGQKLVRSKALTEGQLRKALDQHAGSGKRLGEVLLESGMVDEDQIMMVVRQQIEDAAFDLLRWELGEFLWEPGEETNPEVVIYVTVENLIMEASRRLDELEVIQRKIPSPDTVLAMAATPPEGAVEINITPEEWRILVLVNGSRSVREIGELVGLDDFAAMRTLYGLVSAGLAEVPGRADEDWSDYETEPEARTEPEPAPEPESQPEPEPLPEPLQEAEVVEEPVTELHEQVEAAPEAPEPVAEEPVIEEEPQVEEPVAEEPQEVSLAEQPLMEPEPLLSEPESPAAVEEEPEPEQMPEPVLQAVPDVPEEPEMPVEAFDAPGPGELTAEGPVSAEEDPMAAELLAPAAPEAPAAEEPQAPPAPEPAEAAEVPEIPVSSEPAGESPRVDRIAAVRELAGLFSEGDDDNGKARNRSSETPPEEGAPDNRKRVEDDEQVTRGLISRLIDGVKGL